MALVSVSISFAKSSHALFLPIPVHLHLSIKTARSNKSLSVCAVNSIKSVCSLGHHSMH